MQSKVTLTFRKTEREHFMKRFSKRNRKTFWKYKKKRGAPSGPPLNPPMFCSTPRAPARCSGGHGFDSCRGLRFFLSYALVMLISSLFKFQAATTKPRIKAILVETILTLRSLTYPECSNTLSQNHFPCCLWLHICKIQCAVHCLESKQVISTLQHWNKLCLPLRRNH